MPPINWFTKDPDARLDFSVDWTAWLDGDTIVASEWTPVGLTVDTPIVAAGKTTAWVSGGLPGSTHRLTNRITTSTGRIDDRTLLIRVLER